MKVSGNGVTPLAKAPESARAQPTASNTIARPAATFEQSSPRPQPVRLDAPPAAPSSGTISLADVDRISAMTDGAARNYQITQAYYEISNQTSKLLGKDNGTWCTFAVWASRQVGVSIRGEDLPKFIVDSLKALPGLASAEAKVNSHLKAMGLPQLPSIPDILLKASAAETQMSDSLAGGNRMVFAEIGREFVQFNDTFGNADHYDPAKVDAYLQHFTPEQSRLKVAFAAYAKAQFESDPQKKAQLILYANAQVGAHEQTRLQPYIEGALNAGQPVFHEAIQDAVNASLAHLPGPLKWAAQEELKLLGGVDKLTDAADDVFRHAATAMMMRLTTPTEQLHLGNDLPNDPGHATPFPKDLTNITDPELQKLIGQLDKNPSSLQGTGARDWSDFGQRMNFILDLFRSRQQDPSIFSPPFASPPAALRVA
jgi:hypothetical protein